MKIEILTVLLRQAQTFGMGLDLAYSFGTAIRLGRIPERLVDQARAWGIVGKA